MVSSLAAVAKVVADLAGVSSPSTLESLIEPAAAGNAERAIAQHLMDSPSASVFLGNLATAHPAFARINALAVFVARTSNSSLGYLPDAANSVGGCLAGAVPRRGPAGASCDNFGLDARAMLDAPRKAYVLVGVEPEFDCWDTGRALAASQQAELVVAITPFVSEVTQGYVHVLLPAAAFGETAGTYVNVEGRWQSFQGAVKPPAGARPAWKILRVLGNLFDLEGFGYLSADDVLAEVQAACQGVEPLNLVDGTSRFEPYTSDDLMRVAEVPIYATDALVRRAQALQATPLASLGVLRLHPDVARDLGLAEASEARVRQNGATVTLPLTLDDTVARGCAWIPAALSATAALGAAMGTVEIRSV
jgi:NADH-quinone oxidoreductase subunit G